MVRPVLKFGRLFVKRFLLTPETDTEQSNILFGVLGYYLSSFYVNIYIMSTSSSILKRYSECFGDILGV